MTAHIAIDPGFKGAIAVVSTDKTPQVWDIAVTGTGRQSEYDLSALAQIIHGITVENPASRWLLEWPQTRPDEAPESSKRFGVGMGQLEALIFAYSGEKPVRLSPNKWKGQLGLEGKSGREQEAREEVVRAAVDLVGVHESLLRGPRGAALDGRAEALLMAWWSLTRTVEGFSALDEDQKWLRALCGGRGAKRRRGNGGLPPLV